MSLPERSAVPPRLPLRVAVFNNILLPHRVALLEAFAPLVKQLQVFLSAASEPDRKQPIDWGSLNVCVQRSVRWTRKFRNVHGFEDVSHLQFPYDGYPLLRQYRPDIILSNEFGLRTIVACLYRVLHTKSRLIVWALLSQRTEAQRGRLRLMIRRSILNHTDACFVHGSDGEEYIRALGFAGPVFHIGYVSDNRAFQRPRVPPESGVHRVVYAGQFIDRKGILQFTRALMSWCVAHPTQKVEFILAGEGPQQADLQALQAPPSLQLSFVGHLTTEELAATFARSSLYAFPTLGDEWGMVVNESLAAGLPILASIHAQASIELIQDGNNGWLFDPTDEANILLGIERALQTEPLELEAMSAAARASVSEWTPEKFAERMKDAIVQITGIAPES
jgi:glycosyltransferase involved in cell wall biosynthesis